MDTDSAVRAVVAFPLLDADDRQWIESIRAKHDPEAKRIAAHFTLVFPAVLPLRVDRGPSDARGALDASRSGSCCGARPWRQMRSGPAATCFSFQRMAAMRSPGCTSGSTMVCCSRTRGGIRHVHAAHHGRGGNGPRSASHACRRAEREGPEHPRIDFGDRAGRRDARPRSGMWRIFRSDRCCR